MKTLHNKSLSARLTRMNLMVSGVVLLMAATAFFSYDLLSFRNDLIHNLDAAGEIVGDNSISALMFNDQQSAADTLAGLRRSPDVLSALLITNEGTVFATYGQAEPAVTASHPLAAGEPYHAWISGTHVLTARRVVFQNKPVGIVYISARLNEVGKRAGQYLLIALLIVLICMGAAYLISSMSRRMIEQPIIALADTALLVSRDHDYSVRATVQADSQEIAILVEAFNAMLAQIQEARTNLEARVDQRTAELKAANRELEAFSGMVAHDLRGPLAAIGNIAYILELASGNVQDPTFAYALGQLKTSTTNMSALIDNLLDFARAATSPVKSEPVDLSRIVREIAAELTASDPARQVNFLIADLPEASADVGLMRIVLDNLLRNSWKYTSQHPSAQIEFGSMVAVPKGGKTPQTVYFVRDDGAGFDPERVDQLFHPFHRLHSKSDFSGSGIGLATVERILARRGGSIWAEGAIEKGATFYFTVNREQFLESRPIGLHHETRVTQGQKKSQKFAE
jgi:signal transduction histidine kinase